MARIVGVDIPRNKMFGQYRKSGSEKSGLLNAFYALKEIRSTAASLRFKLLMMATHFNELDALVSSEDSDIKDLIKLKK